MSKLLFVKLIMAILLNIIVPQKTFAQDASFNDEFVKKTQEDFLIVLGAGISGAVLGLSTLSFVDKPARHVYKIWMGASLGVIAGVLYVVYNRAQAGTEDLRASVDFSTNERYTWHHQNMISLESSKDISRGKNFYHVELLNYRF